MKNRLVALALIQLLVVLSGCATNSTPPARQPELLPTYMPTASFKADSLWQSYEVGKAPEDQLDRVYDDEIAGSVIKMLPTVCRKDGAELSERKYFSLTQKSYAMAIAAREMFGAQPPLWVLDAIKKEAANACPRPFGKGDPLAANDKKSQEK